jgi:xylulokinase
MTSAGATVAHVLAIDLGTGGPKVALVTLDGVVIDADHEHVDLILTEDGGVEQDPDRWWEAITAATRRVIGRHRAEPLALEAIAVDAQWFGTVPVDDRGKHLMHAITWLDSRGAPYSRRLFKGPVSIEGYDVRKLRTFIRTAGGIPGHSGKDPTGHILWLQHERPDIFAATATFLEPADYINYRLTGRMVSSFDTIAGHWVTDNRDIDHVRYDDQLLQLSQIPRSKLPELVPTASVVGSLTPEAAADLGLGHGIKVVTAMGDLHAAVLGSGAVSDYAGHLYIGTSAWVTCHVPWKRTDVFHNQASIPSALPGRYFIANENQTAGRCIEWLRDTLQADFATFEKAVNESSPGSGRTIFTPWLNGERTPVDDSSVRAGWHNLSLGTTHADLIRSVYEGVALNARWLMAAVEKFAKHRFDGLNFIGGGAQSDAWCQILADVLDRDIRRVADPQRANARGAAFLASIALGHATAEQLAAKVRIQDTFVPQPPNRAIYDELFGEFVALYKHNRKIHRRLNQERA